MVYCALQSWGGGDFVTAHKLWSRVAMSFHAPPTMTNRSSKMQQLWQDFHFDALVGPEAAAAGVEQPAELRDLTRRRVHSVTEQWPESVVLDGTPKRGRSSPTLAARGAANISFSPAASAVTVCLLTGCRM